MGSPTPSAASGQSLVVLARQHIGESYVFGSLAPKDNSDWKGPWDCAEFASWVVFQQAGALYGCNRDFGDPATADAGTVYWYRDARRLGQIVSLERAARTPGSMVLRIATAGKCGHIVISDGAGGTVEAHSSADGVVTLKLGGRRWDMGILVPGIAYTEAVPVQLPIPPAVYRLTEPLMHGDGVMRIQQALLAAGFSPGVIDGEFGPHTRAAVLAFQLSHGLTPDGEVGPLTLEALDLNS